MKKIEFDEWDGNCPICGKDEFFSGCVENDMGLDGGHIAQDYRCKNCGSKFYIEYWAKAGAVWWGEDHIKIS